MPLSGLLENDVLISMLIAWSLAQVVKPPLYYFLNHKWSWARFLAQAECLLRTRP